MKGHVMKKKSGRIVRKSANDVKKADKRELARVASLKPSAPDRENPPWTDQQFAAAAEARRQRIASGGQVAKRRITIHLDEDLLAYFKQAGEGYQTRINAALRQHVARMEAASNDPISLIESAMAALKRAEQAVAKDR